MLKLPKLPKLMACKGKTWRDVREALGCKDRWAQYVAKGEKDLKISQVMQIAKMLNLGVGDLIGEDGPPPAEAGSAAVVRYHLKRAREILDSRDDEAVEGLIGAIEAAYQDIQQSGKPETVAPQLSDEVAEED